MKENFSIIKNINSVNILVSNDGNDYMPISPICEALGIDDKSQRDKINEDELYSSVKVLIPLTARDGKDYEMVCMPFEYVMLWMGSINPKNVKPEAQDLVRTVRMEIVKAIAFYYRAYKKFAMEKQAAIEFMLTEYEGYQKDFKDAKKRMEESKKKLNEVRAMSFEDWQQQTFDFEAQKTEEPEETEEGEGDE
jgi:hypothetical protein